MKRLILAIFIAVAWPAQATLLLQGAGLQTVSSGPTNQLSIDGGQTAHVDNGSLTVNPSVTTAKGAGLIVCAILTNSSSVLTVTSASLTFTHYKSLVNSNLNDLEIWTAPYSSNATWSILITLASNLYSTATCFGVAGANTVSPFDGNASNPATSTTTTPAITTSNAYDIIIAQISMLGQTNTVGGGWTLAATGAGTYYAVTEYKIVSTTQSSLTATTGSGTSIGAVVTAIVSN